MPDDGEAITLRVIDDISTLNEAHWDACAGTENPFTRHAFLLALEQSKSAGATTGWLPQHLVIEDGNGLVAAMPCYLKNNSYGEYIFDWGWAEAYQRAGRNYYPKIQVAVPFTPATGRRILVRPDADQPKMEAALAGGLVTLTDKHEASSAHITYLTKSEFDHLGEYGFLQRLGQQFHWINRGYESFDDFLGDLTSRRRKTIRKERIEANRDDLDIEILTGDALKPVHMDAFYKFYLSTVDKKWGQSYLTRAFFDMILESMPDSIVLVMVRHDDDYVGGAINFRGADTLFGRNWGCIEQFRMLHFEACYYRAIDFAIEHGLERVEAGAQGPHKISRGYLPAPIYSVHHIADPAFSEAVDQFVRQERAQTKSDMEYILRERSPFRSDLELPGLELPEIKKDPAED